jgi:hypothetical protein
MGFLDKAKEAAEQAATKAKQGVDDVQSKRDASQGYSELGKETYRLIEAGEISNPALDEIAAKIRAAEAGAPAPAETPPAAPEAPAAAAPPAAPEAAAAPAAPAEPPPPAAPPAMPS